MSVREVKRTVEALLHETDFSSVASRIAGLPAKAVVNAAFSLFLHREDLVRWRSVSVMGITTARLAAQHLEEARTVMRRLMWSLNDESGGIGWGAPEAMGDIMARHDRLAAEFHRLLISYIRPDGNYIEYEMLQRGVLWGIGRLAQMRPLLLQDTAELLIPYVRSKDAACSGLAALALRRINPDLDARVLDHLKSDERPVRYYEDGYLIDRTVGDMARGPVCGT